ncbi:MAG: radical SAM protein [Pirellulaceae bacterium]
MGSALIPTNHLRNEARRTGRRVALLAKYPQRDPAMPQFISNHGVRMVEAYLRAAELDGLELRVYDMTQADVQPLVQHLLEFDPDIVGFSAYLWNFPFFVEVATQLKQQDAGRLIVFGGPSARPSMLEQPPFQFAKHFIDALVINEGEITFTEMVRLTDRSAATLAGIGGVALPSHAGWLETPVRPLGDLNELPSPYTMGLVPPGGLGVLQTYRGCPFTCSFCEWGTMESPKRVREVDHLCREFEAMDANQTVGALAVDAGLNLNPLAFENLHQAAQETNYFANRQLICEVYPAKVLDSHIQFLQNVGMPLVGVGLQSFDNEVLAHVERSYDEQRFHDNLRRLTDVAGVAVEIIMGLPGDSPENFRRSFWKARSLPCALRVYHCVVLPSALDGPRAGFV